MMSLLLSSKEFRRIFIFCPVIHQRYVLNTKMSDPFQNLACFSMEVPLTIRSLL
uniref:Uncharacterized protein n=1 Tax=Arundo donax TaxID=35708 RepID=A0A0A9DXU9_ARUDO